MGETLLMRSVRHLVHQRLERLCAADALVELAPYREALAQVRALTELMSPQLADTVEQLEHEIARREELSARATRVLGE